MGPDERSGTGRGGAHGRIAHDVPGRPAHETTDHAYLDAARGAGLNGLLARRSA